MRQCQFCGCHTNATIRRCCAAGETEDEPKAEPSTEASACGSCPHPAHLGPCVRRNGQTSYQCPCLWDTMKPQPIERCSCAESLRYRAALEEIERASRSRSIPRDALADIGYIARRALALEPEGG